MLSIQRAFLYCVDEQSNVYTKPYCFYIHPTTYNSTKSHSLSFSDCSIIIVFIIYYRFFEYRARSHEGHGFAFGLMSSGGVVTRTHTNFLSLSLSLLRVCGV